MASLETVTTVNIGRENPTCKPDCVAFIDKWSPWCDQHPRVALLPVASQHDYYKSLRQKSKSMVREAHRYFQYQRFNYNDQLDGIYQVNTSKRVRQGKPMTPAYRTRPSPIKVMPQLCGRHDLLWVGGFRGTKLKAYAALVALNELMVLNTILGHADSLPDGVMNGLIHAIVGSCNEYPNAKYINYLDLDNCGEGLARFKKNVGFETHNVEYV